MKKYLLLLCLLSIPFSGAKTGAAAQEDSSRIHVSVVLVQLNIAVTDSKGNYISGLGPENFVITEDKIPQKSATFEEGNGPPRRLLDATASDGKPGTPSLENASPVADSDVTLDPTRRFAAPTSSSSSTPATTCTAASSSRRTPSPTSFAPRRCQQNRLLLLQPRPLPRRHAHADRSQVVRGVRSTVAGDDAALYNGLLLTVKDAARLTGKKAIVVFSNGPDNASLVRQKM